MFKNGNIWDVQHLIEDYLGRLFRESSLLYVKYKIYYHKHEQQLKNINIS